MVAWFGFGFGFKIELFRPKKSAQNNNKQIQANGPPVQNWNEPNRWIGPSQTEYTVIKNQIEPQKKRKKEELVRQFESILHGLG